MKKIMRIAMVAVVAAVAGYGIYETQTGSAMSELALANVEALAAGESGFDCHIDWNYSQYCNYYANGPLCPCGF
ncbi:NVEALA domain-containing protein [Bacteroides sp. ET71]|uniref:NVEALA domain-containing protein n=1 Tax=Bacteroides sp. ET71 TaxID=2939421 RepID=UPI002011A719|nr:NVEALA domain-containing protein [Bacteroides sp. ET71]MCL1617278.1 NVEALA domain-containing protein [Bacteroides sp. ET71]